MMKATIAPITAAKTDTMVDPAPERKSSYGLMQIKWREISVGAE